MDTDLTPELRELRQSVREFTSGELTKWAEVIDRTGTIPAELWELFGKQGYHGMRLPPEYGGAGLSVSEYCLTMEEFSRCHRAYTIMANFTSGMTPIAIARHGTTEQHKKYLPAFAAGKFKTAFALTEPGGGSDPASMTTKAEKKGDRWILSGRKHFISGGHEADVIMVIAVTDPEKRARGGITAFLVDKDTPGFSVTRVETTIASDVIKLAELSFDECELPESAVLGTVGNGFKVAMGSLNNGRLSVSCCCIGAAESLLTMATEHAKERKTFGVPLIDRQAIQWMLVDSAIEIKAARAMTYDTLGKFQEGRDVGSAGSMCKVFCSEMVGRVSDRVVQIFGGMGVIRGFPIERFYRDVRHYRVGEGASEIQRIVIARDLAKTGATLAMGGLA
jgi:acyl-CoA dehydrogenase